MLMLFSDRELFRLPFVLGYYPVERAHDGRWRRVEVRVAGPEVTLRHRTGYFAE